MVKDRMLPMQKWGIPTKEKVAPEATLLERLVWVRFDEHWWPALLYENYTELQDHMYKQLDVVTKAQFASAIMRHLNNPQKIKIARLLGKERLEVVEVQDHEYAEFYWQLSQVLPMACRKSNYGGDTKLYLEFHRALDQVEQIIRDISENSFDLIPGGEKKTWVERAEEALAAPNAMSSIGCGNLRHNDEEGYNFLFAALDGMMEQCNSTYDCVACNMDAYNNDKALEDSVTAQSDLVKNTFMGATSIRQKQTRESFRKAIAKQRQIRESGSDAFTNNCIVTDDARNPSTAGYDESIGRSPSTEVLAGISGEDTVGWKLLNSRQDDNSFYPTNVSLFPCPSRSSQEPEVSAYTRNKMYLRTAREHRIEQPIDSREEVPREDREAVYAAARAAAVVELDTSFWDTLTNNFIGY